MAEARQCQVVPLRSRIDAGHGHIKRLEKDIPRIEAEIEKLEARVEEASIALGRHLKEARPSNDGAEYADFKAEEFSLRDALSKVQEGRPVS